MAAQKSAGGKATSNSFSFDKRSDPSMMGDTADTIDKIKDVCSFIEVTDRQREALKAVPMSAFYKTA